MDTFLQFVNGVKISFVIAILSVSCAQLVSSKEDLSEAERLATIRRAHVWTPTDVASMDIKAGPPWPGAFAPGATITCDYADEKMGGRTPKFACTLSPEEWVKVRFGRRNSEVYAGIAASRLLWALGFGADALYPVHVVCRHCPATFAADGTMIGDEIRFDVAAIERKMPGREMESHPGSGWAWPELDLVRESEGGAPRAHRDALKLLAVFLQHTDNKPEQQRLLCVSDTKKHKLAECPEIFMMIHDLGLTFGHANLFNRASVGGVNLDQWARASIWKNAKRCIGNLQPSQTGTLVDPPISEEGRAFLAGLLEQLTDGQLRDLFEVARFPEKPAAGMGSSRKNDVDAWVNTFKHKREEIASVSCPS